MKRRSFLLGSIAAAGAAVAAPAQKKSAKNAAKKEVKPPTAVEAATMPAEGLFMVKPHLQLLDEKSAAVVWMTKRPATGFVEWSQDNGASWKTAWDEKDGLRDAGSRVHVATLRGFKPSMPVVYRACSQETPHVFAYKTFFKGDVEKIESKLAPLVPADGTVSFAMFNDVHCNHAIYSTLLDNVKKPVNFTVFAGDIMNSTDSEACVVHNLLAPLAYVSDKTGAAMWYLRGNHETRGGYARHLRKHLALPGGLFYGAVTLGAGRIAFIDTGEDKEDDHREYSGIVDFDHYLDSQIEWLEDEFASEAWRNAAFRIAVMHIPPSGCKKLDGGMWNGGTRRHKRLCNTLKKSNVSLVLAAHLHSCANSDPNKFCPYPVVVGGGCNILSPEKRIKHPFADATLTHCSYNKEKLVVQQYTSDGKMLFERICKA